MPATDPDSLAAAGLRLAVDGAVATVTLHRPEVRNAQTPAMWRALADVGASLGDDVRVVVVRGEGPTFSAGLDRALLDPATAGEGSVAALMGQSDEQVSGADRRLPAGLHLAPRPAVRLDRGGAGLRDRGGVPAGPLVRPVVAADTAQFSMKEAALGLVPDLTGTQPLLERVGYPRALEICATARMVGAEEAVRIGIALAAVPADDLDATVADLVQALTAPLPGAVRETKALLLDAARRPLDEQRRLEREAQGRRFRELTGLMQPN